MKRILVYCWGALGEAAFTESLRGTGRECITFSGKMNDYHADGAFAKEILELIHGKQVEAVFSYDYFPLLSMICNTNHIPYVSWIYDCPMNTLLSGTLGNENNYIFCFDAWYTEKLVKLGAKHIYHFPLGVEENTFAKIQERESSDPKLRERYGCQVSFVGNLYNGERNRLRRAELSEHTKGYVEGLICAQMLIYGYNLLSDSLNQQIVEEITAKCELKLGERYREDSWQMAADAIGMEVTAREREHILRALSDRHSFTLYSSYPVAEGVRGKHLEEKGYADYETEMPMIFHNSKINLNITSRTIQSGIPKRVLDILACGGFCLTNYQPEIGEYFEDGVDLVMYSGMADLAAKVEYYLSHEEERLAIAENGNRKARDAFSLEKRVAQMWDAVEEDILK